MKRGPNTVMVHRLALALYCVAMSNGAFRIVDKVWTPPGPPHGPSAFVTAAVSLVVGFWFFGSAAYYAGSWALNTLRAWNDN